MGFLVRALVVALSLGVAVVIQNYRLISKPIEPPNLDIKEYWGPGNSADYKENTAVLPFDIKTSPELIADLKAQLARPLKLTEPLEGIAFEYGFNSKELEKVIKYWRDQYLPKWSEREGFLKKFPHYQTQIQGLKVHFLQVKPKNTAGKKVLPLLMLHGWPGSVREFYDIIPLLTTPNDQSDYVFEVIAPSLPGYGWSQGASKVNFGPAQMAVVLRNLMVRLGHNKFAIQGGDWGSIVGSSIAALFPDNVLGYHSTMCSSMSTIAQIKTFLTGLMPNFFINAEHKDFFKSFGDQFAYIMEETGYMHIQATKPDTIGAALTDNPVGLAGYILEKFSTWTNDGHKKLADGGLTKRFTLNALLDNVMIYYVTNSITTSQRLYSEAFSSAQFGLEMDRVPIKAPAGCARFRYELAHSTDFALKDKFINLVHSTYHKDGGHFPAMELPKELYSDFIEYAKKAF